VHEIGGDEDSNRNSTRRLVLLQETSAVGRPEAYERVVQQILLRYLLDDRGFWQQSSLYRIPNFLLNDMARQWRTIAVDFAHKLRRRAAAGWAIRNIKVRMSRKLVYAAGLLSCFRCHLDRALWFVEDNSFEMNVANAVMFLRSTLNQAPLETLANIGIRYPQLHGALESALGAYDDFLALLSDERSRTRLETVPEAEGESDPIFQSARSISHRFREGLLEIFFNPQSEIHQFTRFYAIF
jgi:hypothetical protein